MARGEILLRVLAILFLLLTACLVAFDTETKLLLFVEKKVTYKDLDVLKILVYITSTVAGYNMLQLCKYSFSACPTWSFKGSDYNYMAWISLLVDQIGVYLTLGSNSAAFEAAMFAYNGSEAFQWMKVCDKYSRFCNLIGVALLCGYVASILMALISTISAYKVFRIYSPNCFMRFKTK